jgi:hypothetical protein
MLPGHLLTSVAANLNDGLVQQLQSIELDLKSFATSVVVLHCCASLTVKPVAAESLPLTTASLLEAIAEFESLELRIHAFGSQSFDTLIKVMYFIPLSNLFSLKLYLTFRLRIFILTSKHFRNLSAPACGK